MTFIRLAHYFSAIRFIGTSLLSFLLFLSLLSCTSVIDFEDSYSFQTDGTNVSYTVLMHLEKEYPSPQGGDCWGDIFFQFTAANHIVRIYDLSKKSLIQECQIEESDRGFVPSCHCNTVSFGSTYFDPNDEFPLIYVSTGYSLGGYSGVLVYRITKNENLFKFTLIQTIRFPKMLKPTWVEFVPHKDCCYLCCTGIWSIYKMFLPSVDDGDVILNYEDANSCYFFSSPPSWMLTSRNQDRIYKDSKVIYISGVPQSGEASVLVVLDLDNQLYEYILDFKEIGLYSEPESIFIWKDKLCVAFMDQIVSLDSLSAKL